MANAALSLMTQAALGITGMMFNVGSLSVLALPVAACRLLALDTAAISLVDGECLGD